MGENVRNIVIVAGVVLVVVGVAWFKSAPKESPDADVPAATDTSVRSDDQDGQASGVTASSDAPTTQVAEAKLPRLVDLGADKCIPCIKMAPILKEVRAEYAGKAHVEFIDVWKNPDAAQEYGIRLIPTQIFYDREGKEVWRHEGFLSKEDIVARLKELGA